MSARRYWRDGVTLEERGRRYIEGCLSNPPRRPESNRAVRETVRGMMADWDAAPEAARREAQARADGAVLRALWDLCAPPPDWDPEDERQWTCSPRQAMERYFPEVRP